MKDLDIGTKVYKYQLRGTNAQDVCLVINKRLKSIGSSNYARMIDHTCFEMIYKPSDREEIEVYKIINSYNNKTKK